MIIMEEKQGTAVLGCLEVGVIMMIKRRTKYKVVYYDKYVQSFHGISNV